MINLRCVALKKTHVTTIKNKIIVQVLYFISVGHISSDVTIDNVDLLIASERYIINVLRDLIAI